jgi:DNA-binding transcriptional MerR regulator
LRFNTVSIKKTSVTTVVSDLPAKAFEMTPPTTVDEPAAKPLIRSGTAARVADLSPSTLRIWENRHGVAAPPKAASGQRTYSMKDIERLRLIKRLTVEGHAIGSVARLDTDALVALSTGSQVASTRAPRVLVVGQSAASKLERRLKTAPALVFDDLAHAEREVAHAGAADVLVIHVPSLRASMTDRVTSLQINLPAAHVIVIHSFGAQAVAETLGAAGVTVRREPVSGRELAGLIMSSRPTVETVGRDVVVLRHEVAHRCGQPDRARPQRGGNGGRRARQAPAARSTALQRAARAWRQRLGEPEGVDCSEGAAGQRLHQPISECVTALARLMKSSARRIATSPRFVRAWNTSSASSSGWGFSKVRYRGLQKNATRTFAALALSNLFMCRKRLMAQVRP